MSTPQPPRQASPASLATPAALAALLRPRQWVKNGFVAFPLFFSGNLTVTPLLALTLVAFAAFCMASSAIYCLNDVMDRDSDRRHPVKRRRPVASGAVSTGAAIALTLLLGSAAIALAALCLPGAGASLIIALYLLLNLAYCLRLKHIALVDVALLALGFVLRVLMGSAATGIPASHWIIILTFLLATFLALAKRRDDVLIYELTGRRMRRNINRYNLMYLNVSLAMVGAITVMSYILYTVSPEVAARTPASHWLYITALFVFMAMMRYLQVTLVEQESGSPTRVLLHDRFLQACVACWILTFTLILYL